MNKICVCVVDWQKDNVELCCICEVVFIVEQLVLLELEWDVEDDEVVYFFVYEGEYVIGIVCLLGDGYIGRVLVFKDWCGLKVGDVLMCVVIEEVE